ncbi:MAG: DUF1444 family protein [Planctomycetota bacterium]
MLAWLGLGWLALSLVTAAAFHVIRRRYRPVTIPAEVRVFLRRLEETLRAHHPEVHVRGMLPGRFVLVMEVEGQDVPVPLHQLFRHASTFPEALPQMVDTLLREIANGGLTRISEHRFDEVATRILPQVRSADWVGSRGRSFGDEALVTRALAADLRICYVIDDPWSMVFVCQAHLRQWGVDEESVHRLSTQNLRRLGGEHVPMPGPDDDAVVLRTGDGYDAARVLLLDPERTEGLLVAMPERDTLWLGSGAQGSLSGLMQLNREQSQNSPYPVSPTIYRVQDGQLQPVTEGPAG